MTLSFGTVRFNDHAVNIRDETTLRRQLQDGSNGISA